MLAIKRCVKLATIQILESEDLYLYKPKSIGDYALAKVGR